MNKKVVKVGTRDSILAMWQTRFVVEELKKVTDQYEFEIFSLKTKGDKILDVALAKIGDKGLFTKELEIGLLEGEIDFAVHSMKDMPTVLPEGLRISSMLKRHNPADAFVSDRYASFQELPLGAKVGTSSLRRKAQLLHVRPDLKIYDLRGNVQTRLRKMREEQFDGIILAAAGLERLELFEEIKEELSYDICLPAVSQGVIGVETRENDEDVIALVQLVNDRESEICVRAERALLKSLEGGCQIPIGAYAELNGDDIILKGMVGSLDGKRVLRESICGCSEQCEQLGEMLAERLAELGGRSILEEIRMELNP